jgi:hypothetical protein
MMERIARVFPRKTNMTPTDSMAFVGLPTIEHLAMDIEQVNISVTFSWDIPMADELYEAWQMLGVPVEVGGPAFDDRMGDFTPGMYVKQGIVFTSRGCSKDCWFCSVPRCAHGMIRELPVQDGYNIADDNILGTSESHFRKVIEMLGRQKERAIFSGGLEPALLQPWHAELLKSINPKTMYTAYDTKDDYEPLRQMASIMWDAGFNPNGHQVKCYCLCGYDGDSFEDAEKRMQQVMDLGFLPFAMLYRNESGQTNHEWRKFQREWANSFIVGKKFSEWRKT